MSAHTIRGEDRSSDWMAKGACRGTQRNPTRALGESAEMLYGGYSEYERRQLLRQARNDRGRAVQIARESERRKR